MHCQYTIHLLLHSFLRTVALTHDSNRNNETTTPATNAGVNGTSGLASDVPLPIDCSIFISRCARDATSGLFSTSGVKDAFQLARHRYARICEYVVELVRSLRWVPGRICF